MVEIEFIYEGKGTIIQANLDDICRDICQKYAIKAQLDLKELFFLYNGFKLNLDSQLNQLKINSKKLNILVFDNNYSENLSLKFNLTDLNNNEYDITIDFSNNLNIIAIYNNIFPKKIYKNSFSLEDLKNKSKFFKIYDAVRESYNDIKSFLDQKTFFIQTYGNIVSIGIKKQIGIVYDIIFPLKEEQYDLNDTVSELCIRNINLENKYLNLEQNNNELNNKIINIENNNNELKLKNINLEKKCNELEEKNINLEKKINELNEKHDLLLKKYNEIYENKTIQEFISTDILFSKLRLFFDKSIKDIKLIYNGFDRETFFEKCGGMNNLLFLVKDEEGNEFGGYMSSKLLKNNLLIIKDNNSFIFNLQKKKIFRVINPENAIAIKKRYLICFGSNGKENDFYIYDKKSGGMNISENYGDKEYETTNGRKQFSISEFKVYHLEF